MTTESAREARGEGRAHSSTGFRRLTPNLLQADRTAGAFQGLPEGVKTTGQLLAAFKEAAPRLGLSPRLVHAVDWLFWEAGGRPIVWPSASMQQAALDLSPAQVKVINRALIEARVITMKDSPNGKRYGTRDRAGRHHRGVRLRPLADRGAARGIRASGRGGAGRAGGDGKAAPAGDDCPHRTRVSLPPKFHCAG
jgi:hypothetical protein